MISKRALMIKNRICVLLFMLFLNGAYSQQEKHRFMFGFAYGFGNEIRKKDYTLSNQFVKFQWNYSLKTTADFSYVVVVQPEVNFSHHQLLNPYFVKPDEQNYEALREQFTKRKAVLNYVLNVGGQIQKPISQTLCIYILGSIGPMVTDTETERLSKGFAFSDVIALGFSFKTETGSFAIQPSLRHVSNAGFKSSNAGFNTQNIEFCLLFYL